MATAIYETVRPFWDGRQLHPAGAKIPFAGKPGPNLKPLDAESKAAAEMAAAERDLLEQKRKQELATAAAEAVNAQTDALAAAVAKALAPLEKKIAALEGALAAAETAPKRATKEKAEG